MATFLDPTKHKTPLGEYPTVSVDDSWPDPGLLARKNDELGQRILDYAAKWKDHPNFPPSPWDDRTGTISLIPPDQPRPETDPMPRYRLREDAFLGPSLYSKGQEVPFAGWPVRPFTLEPMNESAERVLSYMTRYGAGRTLPGQPHAAEGVLSFPNPATTFGTPQNYTHRGTFGDPRHVA
jgi:hypothetical protein